MVTDELQNPAVIAHLIAAGTALVLGAAIMLRRKGTLSHKTMGWIYVATMSALAISGIFLRTYTGIPNIDGFTPIHIFVVIVLVPLPSAVWSIYHGDVKGHGGAMTGLFYGALIGAGIFTLLPGRLLGHLLWHNLLGLG